MCELLSIVTVLRVATPKSKIEPGRSRMSKFIATLCARPCRWR